jgi:hypothetical protein
MSDLDVLALAAAQNRILVTHDFRTMPRHFAEFLATGDVSPGVLLVKQRTPLASVIYVWDITLSRGARAVVGAGPGATSEDPAAVH